MNKEKINNFNNHFHSLEVEDVLRHVSSHHSGLSQSEVVERQKEFGFNEITEGAKKHPLLIFLKQFKSHLIYILLLAAFISYIFGKMIDVYVILGVVLLNATMGFIQEYRAEKSISALKKMMVPVARVYRDGELLQIPAKELVCGDIILLEEGDKIAADARIIESKNLRTSEASLTGESIPVDKSIEKLTKETGLADMKNMVWLGTFVAGGQAKAVVVNIGEKTAFGVIAKDIGQIKTERSHFEQKIDLLAKQMGIIAIVGASFIFFIGFFIKKFSFEEIFLFTIASLVSGIPEGLPAILVIVLAIGANRMAKKNAIIRTLPATETLGVATVIITDKTGTLTQNTMNVEKIVLPQEDEIMVSGQGWNPEGEFYKKTKQDRDIIFPLENPRLKKLLHIAAICNNARLIKEEDSYKIIGDPTEAALVVLAEKAGLKKEVLQEKEKWIDEMPFNTDLRYRASLSSLIEEGKTEIYVVGAPEAIVDCATSFLSQDGIEKLDTKNKDELLLRIEVMAKNAMRVLALAYKEVDLKTNSLNPDMINGLVLVGLVGMIDPPRSEVKESIDKAKKAGIRVIMATGDHKETAIAIGKEIGLWEKKENYPDALTEKDLSKMSEKDFHKAVSNVDIFSRLTPNTKLKIAESLQKQGHIVAMTGDGVNDAPALKKADIGIAMGIIGTDVARESSEMVLVDDNFSSIVSAIEEGRIVFTNTRQTSTFLITTNFAEHATLISSLLLFTHLPLLPTQILWLNLVTDGVSGFGLAAEPGHGDVLLEPPRNKKENILSKEAIPFLGLMTLVMAFVTLFFFKYHLVTDGDMEKARTAAFTAMAFTQLFNALNMRSMRQSLFKIGFFTNKYLNIGLGFGVFLQIIAVYFLGGIFHFEPLYFGEFLSIVILSSFVLWFGELYKLIKYSKFVEK